MRRDQIWLEQDPFFPHKQREGLVMLECLTLSQKMASKMEVASQHCDTVPNKTKDILYTVKIERIFYT